MSATITATPVVVTVRCRAFAGGKIADHKIMLDGGAVRVYDDVAGYYTTCHSLSRGAIAKARKAAR